jgi:hypothetical protein
VKLGFIPAIGGYDGSELKETILLLVIILELDPDNDQPPLFGIVGS